MMDLLYIFQTHSAYCLIHWNQQNTNILQQSGWVGGLNIKEIAFRGI